MYIWISYLDMEVPHTGVVSMCSRNSILKYFPLGSQSVSQSANQSALPRLGVEISKSNPTTSRDVLLSTPFGSCSSRLPCECTRVMECRAYWPHTLNLHNHHWMSTHWLLLSINLPTLRCHLLSYIYIYIYT